MKLLRIRLLFLLIIVSASYPAAGNGFSFKDSGPEAPDTAAYVPPFYDDNERCFVCHGQKNYEYTNENLGRQVKAMMFSERMVSRDVFYRSNHKSFSCTDCHSSEYTTFPHPGELRMEENFNCIDCHGGDEMFSQYNFEVIEAEYQNSVHYKLEEQGFNCWKCHGPHDYRISIRNSTNLEETILYDNNICLNCHSDFDRYQLLTDREEVDLIGKHEWLPNQRSHFRSVRCIECHSEVNDTILVSHLINPSVRAIKGCNECHSQNSILMSSLYKFQSKEQRRDGFLNGIILNQSYVIGATRNRYLNNISFGIFALMACAILIHIIFRIKRKHKP